ncbi:acylase [Aestuariirhabdus sp. Z084]|uniref:penicillin acylase family protein n=1 Tax=Aestuariirhabdus haliotis TaxID=2918751 RepID=UPI00201B40FD|nr:acylase [Aestuariirhabdus haliotis]MCL6416487.1 acylase [Aestuariirhabdus haliotis]MCL6420477.1 acylase [Aestuariirhabdus haliotis]
MIRSLQLFFWLLVLSGVGLGGTIVYYAPDEVDLAPLLSRADDYEVEIIRDRFGVPHIYGQRDEDTAFGLAYAHAEDDFATIQDVIMATRGTLAAVKGPDAAKTDYLIRLMRVWEVVNEGYHSRIDAKTRAIAQAYADGINLYAARHPDEVASYLLPVQGQDLVAGFTFKTPLFYGFDTIIGELFAGESPRALSRHSDTAFQFTRQPQPELGSQGIAVAPHRSGDGVTRLLVNSHQPLSGPVAWYEARLHSEEGWDMAGSTFPGSPIILHGHNRNLGWANTVNKPDLVDIYQLRINPDNPDQYWMDGNWHDLEVRQADILVQLLGPLRWEFTEPLYFSAHGPVLKLDHGTFALRWAGMDEMRTLEQLYRLNKANNQSEFESAMSMMAMPSINYVYADRDGNIAHYYNAMMPKRKAGWDWSKDLPGDDSDLIWQEYLPFEQLPMTRNPPAGFVFNANNTPYVSSMGPGQPEPEQFDDSLGVETAMTNRALRLRHLLSTTPAINARELHRIKYDLAYHESHPSIQALRKLLARDLSIELQKHPQLAPALALLKSWDLRTNRSNHAAALGVLTIEPLVDFRENNMASDNLLPNLLAAIERLQTHFGRIDPEYGDFNRLRRGQHSWPLDGGPDIVRAVYGDPDDATGQQIASAGDSYIMFVEWSSAGEVQSRSVHNYGSATLNVSSPHYTDQAPLFATWQDKPLWLDKEHLIQHSSRRYRP